MGIKEEIIKYPKLLTVNNTLNSMCVISEHFLTSDLFKKIVLLTNFLDSKTKINERYYCIINDIISLSECTNCGGVTKFNGTSKGYNKFCSQQCSADYTVPRRKKYMGTADFIKKSEKTKISKYGDKNYNNPNKSKKTCFERYGVSSYAKTQECIEKRKATKLERYGDENYTNVDKAKQTCIDRYGVSHPSKTLEFQEKIKKTNLERYGVDYSTQQHINKNILNKLKNKKWMFNEHITLKKSMLQISKELLVSDITVKLHLVKHDIEITHWKSSHPEQQIAEYIQETYDTKIIRNSRSIISPKEIDIYLPEYNLAIEFNGAYWHRPEVYGGKESWLAYHLNKEIACRDKGIRLLHLWENYGNHPELIHNAMKDVIISSKLEEIYEYIYCG